MLEQVFQPLERSHYCDITQSLCFSYNNILFIRSIVFFFLSVSHFINLTSNIFPPLGVPQRKRVMFAEGEPEKS